MLGVAVVAGVTGMVSVLLIFLAPFLNRIASGVIWLCLSVNWFWFLLAAKLIPWDSGAPWGNVLLSLLFAGVGVIMSVIAVLSLTQRKSVFSWLVIFPVYAAGLLACWSGKVPNTASLSVLGLAATWVVLWRKRFQ